MVNFFHKEINVIFFLKKKEQVGLIEFKKNKIKKNMPVLHINTIVPIQIMKYCCDFNLAMQV